eukprot:5357736-Prymnesium_polylepis.4
MPKHLAVTIVRSATTQAQPQLNHIGLSGQESKDVGPWILKQLHDLGDEWSKASTSDEATQKVLTSGKLFATHNGRASKQCKQPARYLTRDASLESAPSG